MKKLIFATLGLIALLLLSIVAKNANFNLRTLMATGFVALPSASTSAQTKAVVSTSEPTTFPVEIYITVTLNGFVPNALMVKPGTKITWINKSGTSVTITPAVHLAQFPIDELGNNNTESFTFTAMGRYNYTNSKISTQTGVIIVQ